MSNVTFKGSYWDNDGQYQAEYDKAWQQLIPAQGEAEDGWPEALRAISRVGYDYYNNGFCNLWRTWDDGDTVMDSYYKSMVEYLQGRIPYDLYNEFKGWLSTTKTGCRWGTGGDDVIDRIIDHIMINIMNENLLDPCPAK